MIMHSRLSHEERQLCGLALDPGFSLNGGLPEDEQKVERPTKGFIPIEEVGVEHAIRSRLSESQLEACMDPLEYALRPRDPMYGTKVLARNMRLA